MQIKNIASSDKIDDRIILCKSLSSIKTFFGERAFTKKAVIFIILKTVQLKKPSYSSKHKFIYESPSIEQANNMFAIMLSKGYVEFSHYFKPKPGNVLNIPAGEKLYKIGDLRYTECTEMTWFKNRQRKERFLQKEEKIDTRSCRALQQIYTMFGNSPFSYNLVTHTANMVINLGKDKSIELTKAEKVALDHMKMKLYNYDREGFRMVWQSLIRNGYIVQHKIKTPDGYIKTTGLYKINHPYLKHCLSQMI